MSNTPDPYAITADSLAKATEKDLLWRIHCDTAATRRDIATITNIAKFFAVLWVLGAAALMVSFMSAANN